jgi:hypothetical protein
LIKVFSYLTLKNHLVAGLLLSNLLSLAAILCFHYFVERHHSADVAFLATALLLAFPSALYFSFIYTESLFLLLVVLFFLFLFEEKYIAVAIIGFLLPLTKAVGVFCVLPLVCHLFLRKKPWHYYMAAYYGPLLGYACYFMWIYMATGNPFEGFEAQRFFPNHPSISNIFNLSGTAMALIRPVQLHGMLDSAIDRGLFLLVLSFLYPIYKLNKVYFAYALLIGVVPALSSWFLSYSRNMMMCFPLFIAMACLFQPAGRRLPFWYLILVLGSIQVWFLLRHINFIWTA